MEWVLGIVVVLMLGLYFWASRTANREVRKRVQPIIDGILDMKPSQTERDENRNLR